jgi:predicted nucleic acid-binding protein
MEVYDLSRPPELHEAVSLMEKYSDTPMDFADATLVLLSEALQVPDVFTLDRRGFSTYRTRKRRAFRLVLDLA